MICTRNTKKSKENMQMFVKCDFKVKKKLNKSYNYKHCQLLMSNVIFIKDIFLKIF